MISFFSITNVEWFFIWLRRGTMKKDKSWNKFFEDNHRYSDVINGIGCHGEQIIKPSDLTELDSRSNGNYRDMVRKAAFGVGFAIIGIENQETVDYGIPIRIMDYDVGYYRRQKAKITRRNRRRIKKRLISSRELEAGEFLYGFRKCDKVYPVVSIVLYAGEEAWSGPVSLHDMIDFSDIPASIQQLVQNYNVHIVDIRRIKDTSVFRTDVKQVFDFLKCIEDKQALLDLVEKDAYYKSMDRDAYEIVKSYANISKVIRVEDYKVEGGVDVCRAIEDLMTDSRKEGIKEGIKEGQTVVIINMLRQDLPVEKICLFTGCDVEFVNKVKNDIVV